MSQDRESQGLEGQVRELEATVQSLTSELVDTKERVRTLEQAIEPEPSEESTDDDRDTQWVPATDEVDDEETDREMLDSDIILG